MPTLKKMYVGWGAGEGRFINHSCLYKNRLVKTRDPTTSNCLPLFHSLRDFQGILGALSLRLCHFQLQQWADVSGTTSYTPKWFFRNSQCGCECTTPCGKTRTINMCASCHTLVSYVLVLPPEIPENPEYMDWDLRPRGAWVGWKKEMSSFSERPLITLTTTKVLKWTSSHIRHKPNVHLLAMERIWCRSQKLCWCTMKGIFPAFSSCVGRPQNHQHNLQAPGIWAAPAPKWSWELSEDAASKAIQEKEIISRVYSHFSGKDVLV